MINYICDWCKKDVRKEAVNSVEIRHRSFDDAQDCLPHVMLKEFHICDGCMNEIKKNVGGLTLSIDVSKDLPPDGNELPSA